MIELGRAKAATAGIDLDLRLGDMRDLELEEERRPDRLRVPRSPPPAHLGGQAQSFRACCRLASPWRQVRLERVRTITASPRHPTGNGWTTHSLAKSYDVADNRVDILLDDGRISSLWWATTNEWLGLIDVAGLEVEAP